MKLALLSLILPFASQVFGSSEMNAKNNKPSFIATFLANSFVGFVDPGTAEKMSEKLNKPPHKPKTDHINIIKKPFQSTYKADELYNDLNSLPLSDTEDEDEAKTLSQSDSIIDELIVYAHDSNYAGLQVDKYDLNEKMFEAAVLTLKVDRLTALIAKNKHHLLKAEQKALILKYALLTCRKSKETFKYNEIFKILLENGFYPENHEFKKTDLPNDSDYPLLDLLHTSWFCQTFREYDKDIFAKQTKVNYISELIRRGEYDFAMEVLEKGFDPKIKENGEDALDVALDYRYKNYHWQLDTLISMIVKKY